MRNLFLNKKFIIIIIIGIDSILLLILVFFITKFLHLGSRPSQKISHNVGKLSISSRIQNAYIPQHTYIDSENKITFEYPSDWKVTVASGGIINFNAPNTVVGPYLSTIPVDSFGYGLSTSFGYPNNIQGFLKWVNSTYSIPITKNSVTTNETFTVGKNTHIVETIGGVNVYETTLTDPDLGVLSIYFFDAPSGNVVVFSNVVGEQKNPDILPSVIESLKFI